MNMNPVAHHTIFGSYTAPSKAIAPAAERVVHSTLFSSYDAADRVASIPAATTAKNRLLVRFNAWRAARKNARQERELMVLAKGDPRVLNELRCLMACAD